MGYFDSYSTPGRSIAEHEMTVSVFVDPPTTVQRHLVLGSDEAWQEIASVVGDFGDGVVRRRRLEIFGWSTGSERAQLGGRRGGV